MSSIASMVPTRPPKRKAAIKDINNIGPPSGTDHHAEKKRKTAPPSPHAMVSSETDPLKTPHPFYADSEKHGIVLRKYYPSEMSNARARAYINNELPRPIELLQAAQDATATSRANTPVKDAVVHWFKWDLRTRDNSALYLASQKAAEAKVPLIALYVVSPQDFEAHLTAPVRVDFMLRTLQVLKRDLAELAIPLWMETVEKRKDVPGRIVELMQEWGASHLFANMEYEVDELRREAKLVTLLSEKGMAMEVLHDTCIVPPGKLTTGAGKQYSVYSPWFRAWIKHVHENRFLLDLAGSPERNHKSARAKFGRLFECKVPEAPEGKRLSEQERKKFEALWPAGEHEAAKRLSKFCDEAVGKYGQNRNIPANSGTSNLSVHFASGTLSTRTAVRTARDRNNTKKLDGGNEGIQVWISEIAWRDFYKHVLVHWPYIW